MKYAICYRPPNARYSYYFVSAPIGIFGSGFSHSKEKAELFRHKDIAEKMIEIFKSHDPEGRYELEEIKD